MSTAAQQSELLKQLVIERGEPAGQSRHSNVFYIACVLAGVSVSVVAIWFAGSSGSTPQDATATAAYAVNAAKVRQSEVAIEARTTALPLASVLDATGYVVARRAATVSAKTTGKVAAVLIEEGMEVSAGQVLAKLDSAIETSQLRLAEAQVAAARALGAELDAEIVRARLELDRWRTLVESGVASESRLDDLKAELGTLLARQLRADKEVSVAMRRLDVQRIRVDDLVIRAPFDGVVVRKSAQPGEMISPVSAGGGFTRTGICTIVDMDSLEVEVDVNEAYINRVSPRQPVKIQLNAYPESAYEGQVLAVIPAADRSKATIRVRIRFLETDRRVLPDMGVRVAFFDSASGRS